MRFFDFVGIFSQILQSRNRRQNAGYPKTGSSVEMAKNVSRETLGGTLCVRCGNMGTPAKPILYRPCRDTACRVRLLFDKKEAVENVPPECFQNQKTASGTQGGAVLFAPPSKSCRFSHPPSPCARSMAQGISLSADSDSEGYSPSKNTSPAALSWSSLTG